MKQGYWAIHDYARRSVKDIEDFHGWGPLSKLFKRIQKKENHIKANLYGAGFCTGGRASEVLTLRKNQIREKEDLIEVRRMPVLKRYEKQSHSWEYVETPPETHLGKLFEWDPDKELFKRKTYETERLYEYRTFSFPSNEPLAIKLLEYLDEADDLLFPGRASDEIFPELNGKHLSYSTFYRIIADAGYHPHWLRAQRASCLVLEYDYDLAPLMAWFRWEDIQTAMRYVRMGTKTFDKLFGKVQTSVEIPKDAYIQ